MRTKLFQWMIAAILICGATVFTSCLSSEDNPVQEQAKKDRKEFIKHTRENLKDLAENMNFGSWEAANTINQTFNTTVLNNPEFEKAIIPLFREKVRETIKDVEPGSELAAMGYKQYATIDLTKFNYRFTMKEDGSGFDVEEADDFEMIINATMGTKEVILGGNKLTLKASGDTYKQIAKRLGNEELAVVILVPSDFEFSIAGKIPTGWDEGFKGAFKNNVKLSGESEYMNPKTDAVSITGVLTTGVPVSPDGKRAADATELYFESTNDPVGNEAGMKFSFGHNDKSMVELEATGKYIDKDIDFSQLT
ncbi:MAG: hypothetical protein IKN58_12905, partial [Prevotella sp.]|nr:hypothetical protein [Prevotella sp.]